MFFDQLDRLTGLLYEAAREPALWTRVWSEFCEMFGCPVGTFRWTPLPERRGGSVFLHAGEHRELHQALERWTPEEPWWKPAARLAVAEGALTPGEALLPPGDLEATPYWHELLVPWALRPVAAAWVWRSGRGEAVVSLFRPAAAAPLTAEELAWGGRLLVHFKRGLELMEERSRVHRELSALRMSFNDRPTAMALIDERGHVVLANRSLKKLLRERDGVAISRRRLRVRDGAPVEPERRTRSFPARRTVEGAPLWVTVRPVPGEPAGFVGAPRPASLVEIRDPDRRASPDPDLVAMVFGLTPAEARFCSLLVGGSSVKEAASLLAITEQTGRTHLKRAMAKLGARRQAELIAKISALH